jgi:vesicle coat complex subunit
MTRGKDVSMLFMDIIKNMETQDMELKKLIYLYIINYAKSHPDLAILAINSFRKDATDKQNPFLRAMAVRTMGCIRVKQITEYLMDTLRKALKDEDSYVRKTAVLTVAKLYDVSPEIIEDQGLI